MTHHDVLSFAGGLFALLMFIPLFIQVCREHLGQSFASWFLWGALDAILVATLLEQGGNYWIVAGFMIGDLLIAGTLAWRRQFKWGWFETMILLLVVVCGTGWKLSGPRTGTVFSILAVIIAGVPGFIDLKRHPNRRTGWVWLGFSFANLLSFFGGTEMNLEQRLAPGVFTLASLLMVWAGFHPKPLPTVQAAES